jgi:membrane-bound lytic murein transglycosylase D
MPQSRKLLLPLSAILFSFSLNAQLNAPADTISDEAFLRVLDQSLNLYYQEHLANGSADSVIDALGYEAGEVPEFSDEIYCARLERLNQISDFGFDCNSVSLATIRLFAAKRRSFAKICLGRSKIYFDLFEEKLSEYGLPLELKYLAVIESGLRPQVKSHAGALGLWQFMYGTGKMYGLTENSYIDERMDPAKATDAACRLLKKLYGIYGDWNLVLSAYNAGPGNVNKAIRRSGGKRTYWEIRPYLPKETQGYVPNFIAATYLLHYHAEHNILPAENKYHSFQLDTMCLSAGMHMSTIEAISGWATEDIQGLNPVYKSTYIPPTIPQQCITGPLDKIGLLVTLEDSLYALENTVYGGGNPVRPQVPVINNGPDQMVVSNPIRTAPVPKTQEVVTTQYTYHRVKSGESLGKIAALYSVTIQDIMSWNKMSTSRISVGQMLKIQSKITTTIDNPAYTEQQLRDTAAREEAPVVKAEPAPKPKPAAPAKKYYTVKSGDTFGKIAGRNNITISQLQRLNPGVNASRIRVGQKIRVK